LLYIVVPPCQSMFWTSQGLVMTGLV